MFAGGEIQTVWNSVCTEGPEQVRDVEKEDGKLLGVISCCVYVWVGMFVQGRLWYSLFQFRGCC